jgi:hypothetical protein
MSGFNQNVVANVLFTFGLPLVRFWLEHAVTPYERIFYEDGKRVKLTIEHYKTVDDTQPINSQKVTK